MKKKVLIIALAIINFCTASFFDCLNNISLSKLPLKKGLYVATQFTLPSFLLVLYFKEKNNAKLTCTPENFIDYLSVHVILQALIQLVFNKKKFLPGLFNVVVNSTITGAAGVFGANVLNKLREVSPSLENKLIPFIFSIIIPFCGAALACKHQSFL